MQLTDWLLVDVALLLIGLAQTSFDKNWFIQYYIRVVKTGFCLRDFGQTNGQQRHPHFNE